jgi:hypothetical protein
LLAWAAAIDRRQIRIARRGHAVSASRCAAKAPTRFITNPRLDDLIGKAHERRDIGMPIA